MHEAGGDPLTGRAAALAAAGIAVAVAAASADSSVVALALPQLYGRFRTSIVGVSWVLTAYNVAVAATAVLLLVASVRIGRRGYLAGVAVFGAASVACAVAQSLAVLIAARCVQGVGAALLLAGAIGLLVDRLPAGARRWALAAAVGVAVGPAVGGLLTQVFDWRAIFVLQVPIAAWAAAAPFVLGPPSARRAPDDGARGRLAPDLAIGLLFGALVGALFLAVLLLVAGWRYSPIGGAAVVSVLPLAAVVTRRLGEGVAAGCALLALGLVALALLPSEDVVFPLCALALCGAGLGLALPELSERALTHGAGARAGLITVAARHLGLVGALAVVAPILASTLPAAAHRAELRATKVVLDARVGLATKVPVALALGSSFHRARTGEVPDLAKPFDDHGAVHDASLRSARDELIGAVDRSLVGAFRSSFGFCAALAAAAALVVVLSRRRSA